MDAWSGVINDADARPLPEARGFRPYLAGGVGVLRYDVTRTTGLSRFSKTAFGFNIGACANVLFSRHVGAEIDFRYFRYFRNTEDFTLGGSDFPENILYYA